MTTSPTFTADGATDVKTKMPSDDIGLPSVTSSGLWMKNPLLKRLAVTMPRTATI